MELQSLGSWSPCLLSRTYKFESILKKKGKEAPQKATKVSLLIETVVYKDVGVACDLCIFVPEKAAFLFD